MPYTVHFVGLAWFNQESDDRLRVLMPDGRNFGPIPPHVFSISVPPDSLDPQNPPSGWKAAEQERDQFHIEFWPPPSKIVLGGTDQDGDLDASHQIPRLPQLTAVQTTVTVDPERAKKVADFTIQQGMIEVTRFPGKPPELSALVSSLEVKHDQPITITLTSIKDPLNPSADEGEERTITLKAGTEIALVNTSRGESILPGGDKHDAIYSQLCDVPVTLAFAEIAPKDVPELQSAHPFFSSPHATINGPGCSNARMS